MRASYPVMLLAATIKLSVVGQIGGWNWAGGTFWVDSRGGAA